MARGEWRALPAGRGVGGAGGGRRQDDAAAAAEERELPARADRERGIATLAIAPIAAGPASLRKPRVV